MERIDSAQDFGHEQVDLLLKAWCEGSTLSPKEAFMPLRLMLTGKKATPGLPESMAVLGRERVRTRIRAALELIKKLSDPAPSVGESSKSGENSAEKSDEKSDEKSAAASPAKSTTTS